MGWFTAKKKSVELVSAPAMSNRNERVIWVRQAHKKEIDAAISEVHALFNSALNPRTAETLDRPTHTQVMATVTPITDEWLKIDRAHVTDEDAVKMFNILMSYLPEKASLYKRRGQEEGLWQFWNRHKFYGGMSFASQLQDPYDILTRIRRESLIRKTTAGVVQQVAKPDKVEFPTFHPTDKEVAVALNELKTIWVQAKSNKLTVEDEFFIDQSALSYLPDAWKMFDGFQLAKPAARAAAKKIFLEQISLIAGRLDSIVDDKQDLTLQQMEAHTAFLRGAVQG